MPTPDQLGDQVPETSSLDVGYYTRDNTTPKFGSSQTLFCKPCIKVIQQVKSLSGVLPPHQMTRKKEANLKVMIAPWVLQRDRKLKMLT